MNKENLICLFLGGSLEDTVKLKQTFRLLRDNTSRFDEMFKRAFGVDLSKCHKSSVAAMKRWLDNDIPF